MIRFFLALFTASTLFISPASAADEGYGVRLLTHFNKPLLENGVGVGGWLIVPNMVASAGQPLFIIGPSYQGKGWWAEFMVGYRVDKDENGVTSAALIQSNRFQLTPAFFKKRIGVPINLWGNLQFIEMKNWIFPYLFLMADYAVGGGKVLVGVETENYFKPDSLPDSLGETDIAVGPQIVIPFGGLNVITAYQVHVAEGKNNQVWVRAMYNFGAPPKPAKPSPPPSEGT